MLISSQKANVSRAFFSNLGFSKLCEFPFDSDRKLMSSIFVHKNEDFGHFVLAKGAPEEILKVCSSYYPSSELSFENHLKSISPIDMDEQFVNLVSEKSLKMASSGLRVLALALRRINRSQADEISNSNKDTESETNLTFIGLVGLIDPPK